MWTLHLTLLLLLGWGGSGQAARQHPAWEHNTARRLAGPAVELPNYYLPIKVPPETECGQALITFRQALLYPNSSIWPFKMIDSWGKNSDGIMYGNWFYYGSYDECVTIRAPPPSNIRGKYCTIINVNIAEDTQAVGGTTTAEILAEGEEAVKAALWKAAAQYRASRNVRPNPLSVMSSINDETNDLSYSTCMPDACTLEQLQDSLYKVSPAPTYIPIVRMCSTEERRDPLPRNVITFLCVASILLFTVVLATSLEFYILGSGNTALAKQGGVRVLLAFSAYTNMGKLFHMNTNLPPTTITCLYGMRVMSMTWVLWCHQTSVTLEWTANIMHLDKYVDKLPYQVVLNGFPSVDTFFLLSGTLVAGGILRQAQRTGTLGYGIYFAHRLIRLIPAIGMMAWVTSTVVILFIHGPLSDHFLYGQEACQKYWYKDVFFINNFLMKDGDCLGHTWYLAVDMQIYLVAPLMVLPLYFYRRKGEMWMFVVSLVAIIVPGVITYVNDFPPTDLIFLDDAEKMYKFFFEVYVMPWCRAGPYVVGIWLGYVLFSQAGKPVKISPLVVATGWTVATVTGLLVVFGVYSYNTTTKVKAEYDVMTQVTYSALSRPAWGAAVAWVIYACHNGYGGVVNGFLSHPTWQPLSRLTYTIYIFSMVNYPITYNTKVAYYFTHINKVVETAGLLFIVVLIAVVVSLVVESPIINLEKMLLGRAGDAPRPAAPRQVQHAETQTAQDPPEDHEAASTDQHQDDSLYIKVNHDSAQQIGI